MSKTYKQLFVEKAKEFVNSEELKPYIGDSQDVDRFNDVDPDLLWNIGCAVYLDGPKIGEAIFDTEIEDLLLGAEAFDEVMGFGSSLSDRRYWMELYDSMSEEVQAFFWHNLKTLYSIVHQAVYRAGKQQRGQPQ